MRAVLHAHIRTKRYLEWVCRWRCLPVRSWIKGAECYEKGDFAKAAQWYQQGLDAHSNSRAKVNALLDLSHCLFRLRRFDEAEMYLRQVTAICPNAREGFVRLARLQLWLGYAVEALWTMRVCLQKMAADPELVTLFITAVVESGGDAAAVQEAQSHLDRIHYDAGGFLRLEVARARLNLMSSECPIARSEISRLASLNRGPFDSVVTLAEVLIAEGKLAYARHHLHRALAVVPEHPKVLRLLATTYLHEGPFFAPDYAVQLATQACQITGWRGIHELSTLAQAYIAQGDSPAALLAASQAKKVAGRLLGGYPSVDTLERFLQAVTSESQV